MSYKAASPVQTEPPCFRKCHVTSECFSCSFGKYAFFQVAQNTTSCLCKTFLCVILDSFFSLGVLSVHSFNLLNFKVNRNASSGERKPGGLKKKLKGWSLPPDAFGTSCTTSMSCISVSLSILLLALSSLNSLSLGFSFFVVKVEMSCSRAGLGNPVLYPLHSLFTPDSFKLKLWSHFPHRFSATLFFLKPLRLAHSGSEFLFFLFSPNPNPSPPLPPDMSPPCLCAAWHIRCTFRGIHQ